MNIQLVDVDSKIPNLALMKLSAFHKSIGDSVELVRVGLDYYKTNRTAEISNMFSDKTYVSIIFTVNKDKVICFGDGEFVFGGSGYDLRSSLGDADKYEPDYSIYPDCDYSIGFISRGCIRKCPFCFVPNKEGALKKVNEPTDIIRHKKVLFLDNNFLALKDHKELLKQINGTGVKFQFNQGLDIRLLDEETANILSKSNTWGEIYFSYDLIENKKTIEDKILMMSSLVPNWKLKLFLYVNPSNDIENDVMYRIGFCKKNRILPYLMRDLSCFDSDLRSLYNDLAAWCNQPAFFKTNSFDQFVIKRHKTVAPENNPVVVETTVGK